MSSQIIPIRAKRLVNGYIRQFEKQLMDTIIPYSINMICIDYYRSIKLLYYFAEGFHQRFKFINLDLNESYIYNITSLNNNASKDKFIVWNSAICLQKNFKIPQQIKLPCMKNDNRYNIIFKCGGSVDHFNASKSCSAFILSQIVPSNTGQLSYEWELPNYPLPIECHSIIYSNKYGLLSVGGYQNGNERLFYRLNFNNFGKNKSNNNKWKWNKMESTKDKRSWTSIICIDNKLLCVGGYDVNIGAINTVEIYNFSENKWKSDYISHIKHKRYRSGILYDSNHSKIYISGGKWALQNTEWYDFNKNKWFNNIPKYKYKIDHYPILWCEKKNILYIASDSANCLQFIDLRENKKWNVVYGRKHKTNSSSYNIQTLAHKFGVEFKLKNGDHTRLLL